MLHYFGLLLMLASWLGGFFLIRKLYDKDLLTISRHAASNPTAYRIFAATLTVLSLALYYWLIRWFTPHLQLTTVFKAVVTLTIACQIITAVVPDTRDWKHTLHWVSAYTMAWLYIPFSLLIISAPALSTAVVILRKDRAHYLFHQASYVVLFELIILSAAYL
jgi:hypothetical protein